MTPSHQLPLAGLLLFSLIPSQLCTVCEVSKENYSRLNPLLNTMINSKYTHGTAAANVLLSLRLAGIQNERLEQQLINQVRDSEQNKNLTSGQLALDILALGACQNSDETFTYAHLVSQLEKKFQAEIENMGVHDGNPLTNFYQLSLDVLALCLFDGRYSIPKVIKLFTPEDKNFYFGGQFSVDTGAMAVLALTCVKRRIEQGQIKTDKENFKSISNHTESLVKKILSEKKENGLLGNTFSTGEAMQALFVSSNYYNEREWNCQQTLDTVLEEISQGTFHRPIAAAQILPALVGKTYLNVNKDSPCGSGSGDFNISTHEPITGAPTSSSSSILVHYSVKIGKTYSTDVIVPKGSVFLDVMKEAQKINENEFRSYGFLKSDEWDAHPRKITYTQDNTSARGFTNARKLLQAPHFSFTVVESAWGPYITSVQGLEANNHDRTYWELLSGGKPLSQGVGSYVVHNGEDLEVHWSKY